MKPAPSADASGSVRVGMRRAAPCGAPVHRAPELSSTTAVAVARQRNAISGHATPGAAMAVARTPAPTTPTEVPAFTMACAVPVIRSGTTASSRSTNAGDARPAPAPPTKALMTNQPADVLTASPKHPAPAAAPAARSEEHTSELQSRQYLVCRLLLEKKK